MSFEQADQGLGLAVLPPVLEERDHRRLGVDVVGVQFERPAEAGFGLGAAVEAVLGQAQRRPGR